ncbi:MAG TPA: TetR/AcrR family transcriptional regulator C-terminal domain-containing protein, partial [Nonomuraea sp.]|nr:TetR/AcrR family transcriptional regulator C-terminal domain-containing protein [Nonomuraea sp.]
LLGRLPALGPNALRITDRMRAMFASAGFRGMDVDFANATLTAYVFGMTTPEIAWKTSASSQGYDPDEMRAAVAKAAADFPELSARITAERYQDPEVVRAAAFDFGLVSMLDGLERRLPA